MKFSTKGEQLFNRNDRLFGADFRNTMEREEDYRSVEIASEFGLTANDVKKLKKHLFRS